MDGLLLILYPPTLRQVRSESPYLDASFTSTSTDAWLLEDQLGNNTCSYDKAFNTMDYTPCTIKWLDRSIITWSLCNHLYGAVYD